ncbi:MAG: hypothetical protein J3Q66DRAFT_89003 [Benniella sp.]|nr:MAG: hypothetical protein J3Q66DRAFT_89003 [Benniella sp.]
MGFVPSRPFCLSLSTVFVARLIAHTHTPSPTTSSRNLFPSVSSIPPFQLLSHPSIDLRHALIQLHSKMKIHTCEHSHIFPLSHSHFHHPTLSFTHHNDSLCGVQGFTAKKKKKKTDQNAEVTEKKKT